MLSEDEHSLKGSYLLTTQKRFGGAWITYSIDCRVSRNELY